MTTIKAVSVSISREGRLLIVDSKGRLWEKQSLNGDPENWKQLTLPDEPAGGGLRIRSLD